MDKAVARDGGMWNAFTFLDWTTFFETMPADKIDIAMRLEADRMRHSVFDEKEFASERTVVASEPRHEINLSSSLEKRFNKPRFACIRIIMKSSAIWRTFFP